MKSALLLFDPFYADFKKSSTWQKMQMHREDNPCHRELNLARHIDLSISWYLNNLAPNRNDWQVMMTLLAILFHDMWKIESAPGGRARYWRHWAVSNRALLNDGLRVTAATDLDIIALCIANSSAHNPAPQVIAELVNELGGASAVRVWIDLAIANEYGRYCDEGEQLSELEIQDWIRKAQGPINN